MTTTEVLDSDEEYSSSSDEDDEDDSDESNDLGSMKDAVNDVFRSAMERCDEGKPEVGEEMMSVLLKLMPDCPSTNFFYAMCLQEQDKNELALKHFRLAIDYEEDMTGKVRKSMRLLEWLMNLNWLDEAERHASFGVDYYDLLGRPAFICLSRYFGYTGNVSEYKRFQLKYIQTIDEEDESESYSSALHHMAFDLFNNFVFDESMVWMNRYLGSERDDKRISTICMTYSCLKGMIFRDVGMLSTAIDCITYGIELSDEDVCMEFYFNLLWILIEEKDKDKCDHYLSEVRNNIRYDNKWDYYLIYGYYLSVFEMRFDEAEEHFAKSLKLVERYKKIMPTYRDTHHIHTYHFIVGKYYHFINIDLNKALEHYKSAIEIRPKWSLIYYYISRIYYSRKDYKLSLHNLNIGNTSAPYLKVYREYYYPLIINHLIRNTQPCQIWLNGLSNVITDFMLGDIRSVFYNEKFDNIEKLKLAL